MNYFKRWPIKSYKEKGLGDTSILILNKLKKAYEDDRRAEESHGDGDSQERINWYDRRINEINQELSSRE